MRHSPLSRVANKSEQPAKTTRQNEEEKSKRIAIAIKNAATGRAAEMRKKGKSTSRLYALRLPYEEKAHAAEQ